MDEKKDEKLLSAVAAGQHKVYRFYDHDKNNVKFVHVDYADRYILIQKQALLALAGVVKKLADKFTK